MNVKNTVVVLATSAAFASDIIHHDKTHLHTHFHPTHPIDNPVGVKVYGNLNIQSTPGITLASFASLVTS